MNIVNLLTVKHLKQNKARTLITVLGISISVTMITAIVIASFSFLNVFRQYVKSQVGDYHFYAAVQYDEAKEKLESDNRIESVGYSLAIPRSESGYKVSGASHNQTAVGTMIAGDSQYFDYIISCKLDGRYPKKSDEIMVEKSVLQKNNLDLGIGDELEISTGTRKTKDYKSSIISIDITGAYRFQEVFLPLETKRYKIVGILDHNPGTVNVGNLVFRGIDEDEYDSVYAYGKLKKIHVFSYATINEIFDNLGLPKKNRALYGSINELLLMSYFAFEKDNLQVYAIMGAVLLLLIVIMTAAIFLIRNAFSMSYAEKVKYLGMLSSVGATKKQVLESVLLEGLILGTMGSVLGFVSGLSVIAAILKIVSARFVSTGILAISGISSISVSVPTVGILIICVFAFLTVLISIMAPAKKSRRITPIDAIRQRDEIDSAKAIRRSLIISKIFGYEGELAYKSIRRNGRKSKIILASIVVSVMLFVCGNYFCSLFAQYSNINYDRNYQVEADVAIDGKNYKSQTNDFEKFCKTEDSITNFYIVLADWVDNDVTEDGRYIFDDIKKSGLTHTYKDLLDGTVVFIRTYIDDAQFDRLCKKNNIDPKKYYDGNAWLVLNNISHKEKDGPVFNESVVGKKISYEYSQAFADDLDLPLDTVYDYFGDCAFYFGDLVSYDQEDFVCNINKPNSISMYAPITRYYNSLNGDENEETFVSYNILTDNHTKATEKLQEYFESLDNGDGCLVMDYQYYQDRSKAITTLVKVFMYFFIIMIMTITICNIINTITGNIATRTKEFAMLQSVGVTPAGFTKMMVLESMLYSFGGLIISLLLSALVCYGINRVTQFNTIPFQINWAIYAIAVVAVVAIITFTMSIATKRIRKNNIIEVLKQDLL